MTCTRMIIALFITAPNCKPVNKRIDVYSYNGILLISKNELTINTHSNIESHSQKYAEQKKPVIKCTFYMIPCICSVTCKMNLR